MLAFVAGKLKSSASAEVRDLRAPFALELPDSERDGHHRAKRVFHPPVCTRCGCGFHKPFSDHDHYGKSLRKINANQRRFRDVRSGAMVTSSTANSTAKPRFRFQPGKTSGDLCH